jgi:hypothetical protein
MGFKCSKREKNHFIIQYSNVCLQGSKYFLGKCWNLQTFWVWLIVFFAGYLMVSAIYAFVSEVRWSCTLNTNVLSFWAYINRLRFEGKTTFRLIVVIHWSESFYFPFLQLQNRRQRPLKLPAAILNPGLCITDLTFK